MTEAQKAVVLGDRIPARNQSHPSSVRAGGATARLDVSQLPGGTSPLPPVNFTVTVP
ncbi:MAG: hypothetical protein ABSH15_04400 [Verrucomicrobiota bacterium]